MDKETLVGYLKALIRDYGQRGQTFALVMLIPIDPGVIDSKYTLLVSASWLDSRSPKDAVDSILTDLIGQIGSTDSPEYQRIARLTVVKTGDAFVSAITSAFNVTGGAVTLSNCDINGIIIERAILLESHRPTDASMLATEQGLSKKVGRNDLCPCGSGKKFKKCCGKNPSLTTGRPI